MPQPTINDIPSMEDLVAQTTRETRTVIVRAIEAHRALIEQLEAQDAHCDDRIQEIRHEKSSIANAIDSHREAIRSLNGRLSWLPKEDGGNEGAPDRGAD